MTDMANTILWLGVIALLLLACGLWVLAQLASAIGTLKRELLGQKEQQEVTLTGQPLEVREHEGFATSNDLAVLEGRVDAVDADLRSLRKEIVANGETRRASIEAKVEQTRREARDHTESVRIELSGKIDQLPAQLIATLKNTGAIK